MRESIAQAHPVRQEPTTLLDPFPRVFLVEHGHENVLQDVQLGNQVVGLENEAQLLAAQFGELVVVQIAHGLTAYPVLTVGGAIDAAQDVQEGRLPRTRAAHDGPVLARTEAEAQVVEGVHLFGAHGVHA